MDVQRQSLSVFLLSTALKRSHGDGDGTEEGSDAACVRTARAGPGATLMLADDTAGEGACGLDSAAKEAGAAGVLDGFVERGLAGEDDAVGEGGRVGDVGLEGDVRGDDAARTRHTELVRAQAGRKEQERGVAALERVEVGRDNLLVVRREERGRGRRSAGDLSRAVLAAVVLGARRLLHGDERVEDIVDLEDTLIQARRKLGLACAVEVREGAPDGGL